MKAHRKILLATTVALLSALPAVSAQQGEITVKGEVIQVQQRVRADSGGQMGQVQNCSCSVVEIGTAINCRTAAWYAVSRDWAPGVVAPVIAVPVPKEEAASDAEEAADLPPLAALS